MIPVSDGEHAAVALDHVADTAEAEAAEQRRLAGTARTAAKQARRFGRWSDLVAAGLPQVLLHGLTAGAARLARAATGLRLAVMSGLAKEGFSHGQIGRYLAVSRQRVSSLLARRNR